MKRVISIISLIILSFTVKAQVNFAGFGQPINNGAYPTTKDSLNQGGLMALTDTFGRNAITPERRKRGMFVVTNDSVVWVLKGGLTNQYWKLLSLGSQVDTTTYFRKILLSPNQNGLYFIRMAGDTFKVSFSSIMGSGGGITGYDSTAYHGIQMMTDSPFFYLVKTPYHKDKISFTSVGGSGGGGGGGTTDTSSLSNRINQKSDKSLTITINGVTQNLSANRTWSLTTDNVPEGTTNHYSEWIRDTYGLHYGSNVALGLNSDTSKLRVANIENGNNIVVTGAGYSASSGAYYQSRASHRVPMLSYQGWRDNAPNQMAAEIGAIDRVGTAGFSNLYEIPVRTADIYFSVAKTLASTYGQFLIQAAYIRAGQIGPAFGVGPGMPDSALVFDVQDGARLSRVAPRLNTTAINELVDVPQYAMVINTDSIGLFMNVSTNRNAPVFVRFGAGSGSNPGITGLSGDGTATGSGSVNFTLTPVNANVGSFTNANIVVDAKGRILSASNGTSSGTGTVTSVGSIPSLFTTANPTGASTFTLTNAGGYTLWGRSSGTGAPSYQSGVDSNWIPSLHSQVYYDLRYLNTASKGIYKRGLNFELQDTLNGAGTKFMWVSAKGAFRAGSVSSTQWDISNIGTYSFSANVDNKATGYASTALGAASVASGFGATALSGTVASGDYSVGLNGGNASGAYSTASGENSFAQARSSFANGVGIRARSAYGFVFGSYNDSSINADPLNWNIANKALQIGIGNPNTSTYANGLEMSFAGKLKLNKYGTSGFASGTPIYNLQVDASGNVIQGALSGGGSGTVTSFTKTDGYGIISSVSNSTTTPNHSVQVDTSLIQPKGSNAIYLAAKQGNLTITTIGSGAASITGNIINIPTPPALTATTYTPTSTNFGLVAAPTVQAAYYTKTGNIVTVTIKGSLTPNSAGLMDVFFSLPLSVTSAANQMGNGIIYEHNGSIRTFTTGAVVYNSTGAGSAELLFNSTQTTVATYSITFDYIN